MKEITGYIEKIYFRNDSNGYTAFLVETEEDEVNCVGCLPSVDPGQRIWVKGEEEFHPVHGDQIKIKEYRFLELEDLKAIERYLGSGAIKGVGAALATRIVKRFGEQTYEIIEREPERLAEIKGISERMAREIGIQLFEKRDTRNAMSFLQQYGISNTMAIRIYEQYGNEIYTILKDNPYRLAEDISGIGFKIADEIARKAGIRGDSEFRIRSGLVYVLRNAGGEGHMYLPKQELLAQAGDMLGLSAADMEMFVENLAMERKVILKQEDGEENVYIPSAYYGEMNCARMLHDLNLSLGGEKGITEEEKADILKRVTAIEERLEIALDPLQREAVLQAITHGVSILTGGPGTGKTTTINVMIRFFLDDGLDIMLAAPTGRAAKRMSEATGYEARTIHRMLELSGAVADQDRNARFERNEDNPLEADVIIVDEMSMVDAYLFQSLLKAISVGTRLIMVGDMHQLPSVGPGQVLHDLIESRSFVVTGLEKIFRQSEESDIVLNAHRIHQGKQISLDNKSKDFFFLERNDVQVIYKHMIQLVLDKLPRYVRASSYDIQVLTPMRRGPLGVEQLNRILQKYLNPEHPSKKEYETGKTLFREGDKVMQIKNNYQIDWEIVGGFGITVDKGTGVFNGDVGIIRQIDEANRRMIVEFEDKKQVVYSFSMLEELELAYAVTIHKSQGSEYPGVVMPLLSGPRMLFNRNLLYTAVTRGKNCVTILGSSRVVQEMIDNTYENRRYTGLLRRIQELEV